MATIQILDQRDTENERVVILLSDLPEDIDVDFVRKISREIRSRLLAGVDTLKSSVSIQELKQAVTDGIITRDQVLQILNR